MKKDNSICENKKARFNYNLLDNYEAGIVLTGTEIKSIRENGCNINDAYVVIRDGNAEIVNMFISKFSLGTLFNHEERRTRRLLLNKEEIRKLSQKVKLNGCTIVPLKAYYVNGNVKILISLAKGKNVHDKRESEKKRDIERHIKERNTDE